MIEGPGGARLLLEAPHLVLGHGHVGEDLDGHVAADALVAGTPHLAHAARTDMGEDLVWPDRHPFCDCHGPAWRLLYVPDYQRVAVTTKASWKVSTSRRRCP